MRKTESEREGERENSVNRGCTHNLSTCISAVYISSRSDLNSGREEEVRAYLVQVLETGAVVKLAHDRGHLRRTTRERKVSKEVHQVSQHLKNNHSKQEKEREIKQDANDTFFLSLIIHTRF